MVFFNCIQIYPQTLNQYFHTSSSFSFVSFFPDILCSLIEIGGGLKQLSESATMSNTSMSLYLPLSLLTFGGLSCIVQTYFIIKNTGLKINTYIKHKVIQSWIYIILFLIFWGWCVVIYCRGTKKHLNQVVGDIKLYVTQKRNR